MPVTVTARNIIASIALILVGAAIVIGAAVGLAGNAHAGIEIFGNDDSTSDAPSSTATPNPPANQKPFWTNKGTFYPNHKGSFY
jgi:hypothetical protein